MSLLKRIEKGTAAAPATAAEIQDDLARKRLGRLFNR